MGANETYKKESFAQNTRVWRLHNSDRFYSRPPFQSLAFCTSQLKFSVGNIWTKRGPDLRPDLMAVLFFTLPQPKLLHEHGQSFPLAIFRATFLSIFCRRIFCTIFYALLGGETFSVASSSSPWLFFQLELATLRKLRKLCAWPTLILVHTLVLVLSS